MSQDDRVIHGEILPPESRGVRMPNGTPLGLGVLGAARFNAIRRVVDQYERALRSKEAAVMAEGAVASAIARREVARQQLIHIVLIRDEESERIQHVIGMARMRRELERMDLEDQLAERRARRYGAPQAEPDSGLASKSAPDEFAAFMDDLRKLPEIAAAVAAAKEQIIRQAGGENRLSEAQRAVCEMFDSMLQSFMSKKAGEAAL